MTLYDITTEISTAPVYPGDPETLVERVYDVHTGDPYTVSSLTMSLHTGTHIEAPAHYIRNGNEINEIPLPSFFGPCRVVACNGYHGVLTGADIDDLVPAGTRRVLLKTLGSVKLSKSAVFPLVSAGVELIGIDAPSIAEPAAENEIHTELLKAGIVILEGLNLRQVQSGDYTMMALPLKIDGVEASPCRAILMK